MFDSLPKRMPVIGVAAVIWNDDQQVLLIRRTKEPRKGQWSLPGGKVEFGETLKDAVIREVREETGLEIEIVGLIDALETMLDAGAGAPDSHFVLIDYSARVIAGTARAGSDAADPTWFSRQALDALPMWDEMRRIIHMSDKQVWG